MKAGKDLKSRCLWACLVLLTPMKIAVAQDYSTLDVREKLVVANNILAMEGLVGPFGHVSVRMQKEGKFRISDHRSPNEVTVDHIKEVKIDITPEAVEQQDLYREVFFHSSIYRELPEVNAVVHTHAPFAVALGTLQLSHNKVLPTTNPGANLEQAVLRAIYLEFEARTQIRSHSAGEPIPYTASESDLFKRTVAVEHAWHYYVDRFRQSEKKKP